MSSDVEQCVANCEDTVEERQPINSRTPTPSLPVNRITTYPLELVWMGLLTCEELLDGFGSVLVVTARFTKYAVVIPDGNRISKTIA